MKRIFFCIFPFLLFFNTILIAQSITWQRVLNNNYGSISKVQQTYDGGYIALGTDRINNEFKIYLIKLNSLGSTQWTKIFGVGPTNGYWVEETSDRGFIIGGSTDSGTTDHDAYLIKTDSSGEIQWQRRYQNSVFDFCYCVKQTPDGGYILSCRYFPNLIGTWFIKTDGLGNIIWQKIYYNNYELIQAYREIEILENGYISVGWIGLPNQNPDVYVMRLDFNGDTLWTRRYGGNYADVGLSIDEIENKGFIIGGYSSSLSSDNYESYLIKIDTFGNIVWNKTYNSSITNDNEYCYAVKYKPNYGFIITGKSDSLGGKKVMQ